MAFPVGGNDKKVVTVTEIGPFGHSSERRVIVSSQPSPFGGTITTFARPNAERRMLSENDRQNQNTNVCVLV